jgi:outer membrane protein OmpA-like peptidoglycan-associated protein
VTKKKLIGIVVAALLIYVVAGHFGYLPSAFKAKSSVPQAVDLSQAANIETSNTSINAVALPSSKLATVQAPPIRIELYPWTADHGILFANGGPQTTEGSLMAQHGVKVLIIRRDDAEKMKAAQAQFASAFHDGQAHPSVGTHFVIIMGDGGAQYIASLNQTLLPLCGKKFDVTQPEQSCDDYRAEVVGAVGYSRGEDACWGPQEWKDNPQAMKGGLIAAYLRDGDWNLCQYALANSGIKNNPDETTYDPEAMNWVATDDFLKATEAYVTGHCEDRKVVKDGKLTGETKHACVQGVATWTPGDVNLAKQRGGLVKLISTKENKYQMPAVVIGIRAWDTRNAKLVQGMLAAALEGGDQVKHFDAALSKAGQIAYNVYADQSPAYWVKYFKGVTERDKTGLPVQLGGSTTMNLADNLILFGLAEGSGGLTSSLYNASYTGFGNVVKQQYPKLFPGFPPIDQAVNTQFITALAASTTKKDDADLGAFEDNNSPIAAESIVAKRNWNITFETGRATFTPTAASTLEDLYNQLLVGGGLAVEVDGHTDATGSPEANMVLSEQRANAVKAYLEQRNPKLFPQGRIVVRAFGSTMPVASNATVAGKAQNRRVTIVLGTQG